MTIKGVVLFCRKIGTVGLLKKLCRSPQRTVDFSYDSVYNRTLWTDTLGSVSTSYTDNALNQYSAVGGTTPTYDSKGNITSGYGGGLTLAYDAENRLTSAGAVTYGYDVLGRRISRTVSGATTTYVYDGPHIIAEYSSTGSLTKKYIYGPGIDQPVAMIKVASGVETWYFYYTDALGSVRMLTNASGAVVESYTYDPYGQPRVMYAAGLDGNWLTEDVATYTNSHILRGNPILFTGRWWDSTTQLYYYRFRDYSPQLGRFLQPDPAGYIDTMNLYAYCGNNPINFRDPHGLWIKGWLGGVAGCAGGSLLYWAATAGAAVTAPAWVVPVGVGLVIGGAALGVWECFDDDDAVDQAVQNAKENVNKHAQDIYDKIGEVPGESPPTPGNCPGK